MTTDAAVSSQDVSMPRMVDAAAGGALMSCLSCEIFEGGAPRDRLLDGAEPGSVGGLGDVVRPHDERVFARLHVVALAHAGRGVAEPLVHRLRRLVGDAHLEGE